MPGRFPTEDEITISRTAVPGIIGSDGDTTVPVDVREMELAAQLSRSVPDTDERPRVIRRAAGTGSEGFDPVAALEVAGVGAAISTTVRRVSETGASLALVDPGALSLAQGTSVMVRFNVAGESMRLPGVVAFYRASGQGRPGGVSVRWDAPRNISTDRLAGMVARIQAANLAAD